MTTNEDSALNKVTDSEANSRYSREISTRDNQLSRQFICEGGSRTSEQKLLNTFTGISDSLLLKGIVIDAKHHFEADTAYIAEINGDDTVTIAVHSGISTPEIEVYVRNFIDKVEIQSYISRAPVIISDTWADPRFFIEGKTSFANRSIMAFPIFSGSYVLGIVGLQNREINRFDSDSLKKINEFAARTARVLERNVFERKCQIQEKKLGILNELSCKLSMASSPGILTSAVSDILKKHLSPEILKVEFFKHEKDMDSLPINIKKILFRKKLDFLNEQDGENTIIAPILVCEQLAGYLLVKKIGIQEYTDTIDSIASLSGCAYRRIHLDREILSKGSEIQALEAIAEYEMSSGLLSSSSLDDILEATMDIILKLLRVERMNIMLYDRQKEELYVVASWGMDDLPLGVDRLKLGEGVAGHALKTGKPYQMPVRGVDEIFIDSPPEQKEIRSILAFPLMVEGRKIGVINVGSVYHYRIFSDSEKKKLSLIASRAALAIENSILMKERMNFLDELTRKNNTLEKRTRELSDREEKLTNTTGQLRESLDRLEKTGSRLSELYDFSRAISRSLELEMILETGLNRISKVLSDPDINMHLSILDSELQYYIENSSRKIPGKLISFEILKKELPEEVFHLLTVDKKTVSRKNLKEDIDLQLSPLFRDYGSFYAFPLTAGEKVHGILIIRGLRENILAVEDIHLLINMVNHMTMAIDNSIRYLEIMDRSERVNLINRMNRDIGFSLDMGDLLDKLATFSCKMLKLQSAALYLHDENNNLKLLELKDNNTKRELLESKEVIDILEGFIKSRKVFFASSPEDLQKRKFSVFNQINANSLIIMPLYSKHRKIGMLLLFDRRSIPYLPRQVEFYRLFSSQVALIIDNAYLFAGIMNEKDRIESVFRSMKEGLVCIDREHRITVFNRAAEEITGWKEHEILGKPCKTILCCDSASEKRECSDFCVLDNIIETDEKVKELRVEGKYLTPAGEEKYLSAVLSVLSLDGKPAGGVFVFRDVTEEKEYNKRRQDYLAGLSHDMFTPLTAIKGYTTTLLLHRERFDQDTQIRFVKIINSEIDRITRILYNLMSLSRMETQHLTANIQPQILIYIIQKVVDIHSLNTDKHQLVIDGSIKKTPPLLADGDHLEQILNNLISNAIKYSPAGGDITISSRQDGDFYQIIVEDRGIGVEEQNLEKIFNRYERASHKSIHSISGMGLGLFITRALVSIQGGEIFAERIPEGGSRFIFTLPMAKL